MSDEKCDRGSWTVHRLLSLKVLLPGFLSLVLLASIVIVSQFENIQLNKDLKREFCFCFICHFYPPFTRKRIVSLYFGREVRTRLGVSFFEVYGPPVFHIKVGRPVKCLAQGHNKRTCRLVLHNLP